VKRHPLDALTVVSLAFVLVAGAVWGMWYAGWEPVSFAVAGPLLLVLLGVAGLVITFLAARHASRSGRDHDARVRTDAVRPEPADADTADADNATTEVDDLTESLTTTTTTTDEPTLTLEDLTRPSDEGDDKR
jgi:ABC-type oligopeptide transport system substrate-binding subunit